ncbi:MAG: LysR family transcriptional regulator [Oscillospiraceae bacterium]|jgi:DNA-binding transcriptional LysR family regulator|nr:LysR family transcriptional regulator [Oscillospiraceae bacterium]
MNQINYDWYKVFQLAAQHQNITKAAALLRISQPAVSQMIHQLESSLGCKLFIRTKKGVLLTEEGKLLYTHITRGISEITLAEKLLEARLNLESGEIRIGASDMTLEFFLLPHLENFHKRYPGIKIQVTNGPTPDTLRLLRQGEIDFCAVSEPFEETAAFAVTPVREIEDVFIAANSYKHLFGIALSRDELAQQPLILLEKNTSTRKFIDDYFTRNNSEPDPEFELATSRLIAQFAKRNLGIGCVVKDFVQEDLGNGLLSLLQLQTPLPKRHICIVQKYDIISKASDRLLELILS